MRLASQRLAGRPATSVLEVVEHLLAIQAQDGRGMRLAIRSRSDGLAASDVDRALTDERSVVVSWLNRGTLHLVPSEDYWWLHQLLAPRMATNNARRLGQEGVSPTQADRGVAAVTSALEEGPLTREQLRERLDAEGVPTDGQALTHVLIAASIRHHVVRGPVVDGHHTFVDATRWLGPAPAPLERDEALARLAERYLRGHAPATDRDLAYWTGLTLTDARRGLAALGDPVGETTLAPAPEALSPPRLLGPFDPVLHGWASRGWVVGPDESGIVTSNGIFRATALVDGKVVATWRLANGELSIQPREPIDPDTLAALRADGDDVRRYLSS